MSMYNPYDPYGMGDEDEQMDPSSASAMLAQLQQQYAQATSREQQARTQAQQAAAARFKQAEEAIRQNRFGAPTRAEQLFAISQSLLAPRFQRGLAGTLQNVVPTLGKIAGARTQAEQEREAALFKLQQSQAMGEEEATLSGLGDERKSLLDMMKVYGPLAKPARPRTGFNPVSGALMDMDTAEEITPVSSVPSGAIQQLQSYLSDPNNTPENKRTAISNFEKRFRVPANRVLSGGM